MRVFTFSKILLKEQGLIADRNLSLGLQLPRGADFLVLAWGQLQGLGLMLGMDRARLMLGMDRANASASGMKPYMGLV